MKYAIAVVNYNTLGFTKNLIQDLLEQNDKRFKLFLFDQGSTEPNTEDFLKQCECRNITVIRNKSNRPLNHIWNEFFKTEKYDLISFLNSDIRIPKNYTKDTLECFEKLDCDCVLHATNNSEYFQSKKELQYVFPMNKEIMQGWEFTIKTKKYKEIPKEIKFYCGDDFIFEHLDYTKIVMVLSSPVIHYQGRTKKSRYSIEKPSASTDIEAFKNLGFRHHRKIDERFSKLKPEFYEFVYE